MSIVVCVILLTGHTWAQIPRHPGPQKFLHDLAGVINPAEYRQLQELQQQVFAEVQVPIVVVTISHMRAYDVRAVDIESFAKKWFNSWGIGSRQKNDGILVIVSIIDRKSRIELGAAWGKRFDEYCQRVMDDQMIPRFKSRDFGDGLVAGVEKLADMARAGPRSNPPTPGLSDKFAGASRFLKKSNPIAQWGGIPILLVMVLIGLGCFVAAWFFPDRRDKLVIAGTVIIGLAIFFWFIVIFFALYARGTGRFHQMSRDGGVGGGGGGFGGGFSGGGGASGGW